jgi:NarL family two-component system response regulator LiaR
MLDIAIIDRDGFYIDAVMSVIEQQPDMRVVASATIREDFAGHAQCAEIAIIQQETPPLTRELIREVLEEHPHVKVVVLGARDDPQVLVSYIEAGAIGCVRDTETLDQLLQVVRVVGAGEAIINPELVAPLCRRLAELGRLTIERFAFDREGVELTERQREVLDLLAQGRTNREIADELSISIGTVKNHMHKIFGILQVRSRKEAAMVYAEIGAVEDARKA